ncbi:MAG: PilX N-terminal domain-containing pilus assembly protein [Pseudomonadota bacterium]
MSHLRLGKQQGAVLIVSLMMLLVLTVLGLSVVSNATMDVRMTRNFQHSALAFQGAESAISNVIVRGDENSTAPAYVATTDPLLTTVMAGEGSTTTVTETIAASAAVATTSTVTFAGQGGVLCTGVTLGEDSQFACNNFSVATLATINETATRTTHEQGLSRGGLKYK